MPVLNTKMSLLQTLLYSADGSGDSPVKTMSNDKTPQHSTPIKNDGKSHPILFSSLGSSALPTPVIGNHDIKTHSEPPCKDPGLHKPQIISDHRIKNPQISGVTDGELSIIQKQRQELKLLITELRDRDRELNDMVAAHQAQLLAWEEDRQKLLTLQQKCTVYEDEVKEHKKNLKKLATYTKTLKSERESHKSEIEDLKDKLARVNQEKGSQNAQLHQFVEKDRSMCENVKVLSSAIGHLEARETELATLIKLKDKELSEASLHISEMNKRLCQMDQRCKECYDIMVDSQKQAKDWKSKYSELKRDNEKLKENYSSLMTQSQTRQEELEETRKKVGDLERELTLAGERECRKSDVLESLKGKQERTVQELSTLRQLYERQQRELSLLQLNLDTSRELIVQQQVALGESHIDIIDPELTEEQDEQKAIKSSPFSPRKSQSLSPKHVPKREAISKVNTSDGEHDTSLEEERQKFDQLYLKFLQDPDGPGSQNSSFTSFNIDELNHTDTSVANREEIISPTSKLHKLLAESRQMVERLEISTLSERRSQSQAKKST